MHTVLLRAAVAALVACSAATAFQLPLPTTVRGAAVVPSTATAMGSRRSSACWATRPEGPFRESPISSQERFARTRRNRQLRDLEKDSERWFEKQAAREASGELGLLENPAFYTLLFFAVPAVILVWGAGTGVIPGFVGYDYAYPEQ